MTDHGPGERPQDKMVTLGKLASGLAHELNNPAAAVQRSASELQLRLSRLPDLVARMSDHGVNASQIKAADTGCATALRRKPASALTSMERGELEDELSDWLEAHGIEESWIVAETLVDCGRSTVDLEELASQVPSEGLADVIAWMEGSIAADRLIGEITAAAGRISELVNSVRVFFHPELATEKQSVDVHPGINSTLTLLGHKLKKSGIQVERHYATDLPKVVAHASELNQVWTNLIDNAIDAMEDAGHLILETKRSGDVVDVAIIDNGKGIDPEIKDRIMEPFFTTKDIGDGTGLGLDIVHRIVVEGHGGKLTVESEAGRTSFVVSLPIAP